MPRREARGANLSHLGIRLLGLGNLAVGLFGLAMPRQAALLWTSSAALERSPVRPEWYRLFALRDVALGALLVAGDAPGLLRWTLRARVAFDLADALTFGWPALRLGDAAGVARSLGGALASAVPSWLLARRPS